VTEDFSQSHCDERHTRLDRVCESMDRRLEKVENRFLITVTTLTLNLIGVISLLIIQIARGSGQ